MPRKHTKTIEQSQIVHDPQEFLAAALAYAEKGLYVLPVHEPLFDSKGTCIGCTCGQPHTKSPTSRGKHPRISDWENEASCDPDQIKTWWAQWPTANIGIAAGKSGLVDFDLDTYKDCYSGTEIFTPSDKQTITQISGNGGEHLIFAMPVNAHYTNAKGKLPAWVDIRGYGGQFIVPPSIHYSGRTYEWEVGYSPFECEPLPLPETLTKILDATVTTNGEARAIVKFSTNGSHPPDLNRWKINKKTLAYIHNPPDQGKRSEAIFSVLCALIDNTATDDEILGVFTHYPIGQTGRFAAEGEKWLAGEISRVRAKHTEKLNSFYRSTEIGLGERIAASHATEIRCIFLKDKKQIWRVWDGKVWVTDNGAEMVRRAKDTIRGMYTEAAQLEEDNVRKQFIKFVMACEGRQKLSAGVYFAGAEPGITATVDGFDLDPYLLNCENGVLDLHTGNLLPHDPQYMCSRLAVAYDLACPTPNWLAFLAKFFDGKPEMIEFLRRIGGYALTGKATEKNFFILNGASGNNGKSTYLGVLRSILHDYAYSIKLDVLTEIGYKSGGDTATPSLLAMQGARFLVSDEIPDGWRPNVSLIKNISNGGIEPINVRGLYGEAASYMPTQTLFLFGNPKPKMPSEDEGLWHRALLVPFTYQIPDSEADREFAQKLIPELPGILAWFAKGTRDWLAHGLQIPQVVTVATIQYRQEMDLVQRFIDEMCIVGLDHKVAAGKLYNEWDNWRKGKGGQAYSKIAFGKKLDAMGYKTKESSGNWRLGISLPYADEFTLRRE